MCNFFSPAPFMGITPFGGGGYDDEQLRAIDDKQAYADQRARKRDDMMVFPDGRDRGDTNVLRVDGA